MYEAAFGLSEKPFTITPDPGYLYLSAQHREALAHLVYGVTQRSGFVQLTGEIGLGKTLLVRALLQRLPETTDVALIYRPAGSVQEFIGAILRELGVALPPRHDSVNALVERLNEALLAAHARQRTTVLVVDEAQNLSAAMIEQLRLLTNLETHRDKLLQIVLVGQPELRRLLRQPNLRQVAQRITARYHLEPLQRAETADYVRHRLQIAGGPGDLFSTRALRRLHRATGGIPRLINIIADRSLLGAYARGAERVRAGTVARAARELSSESPWRPGFVALAAGTAGLALTALLWYAVWQQDLANAVDAVASTAPQERLDERLAGLEKQTRLPQAFTTLFERWAVALPIGDDRTPCQIAVASGLRCHYQRGDLEALLRLDRPAVVELVDGDGLSYHTVLTGAGPRQAIVRAGDHRIELSRATLERYWTGEFLLLWRPPRLAEQPPKKPGDEGDAVVWARRRLAESDVTGSGAVDRTYDRALVAQVRHFQQASGLPANGQLDEPTLLHLQARGSTGPRLGSH